MSKVLYGQWAVLKARLNKFKIAASSSFLKDELQKYGEDVADRVRKHIFAQDLPWPPLSFKTIEKKGFQQALLEKGEYVNSFKVSVYQRGRYVLEMKVQPEGKHRGSGLDMQVLGRYLEYGTSRIPARPHWRPTLVEAVTLARGKLTDQIKSVLVFE